MATQAHGPLLVMLVDNDPHHLLYNSHILQRFGYRVCSARNAEESMKLAVKAVPALILTELDLPHMSGLDLLYRLRTEPCTAQVPVVALTRNGDNGTEARCLRAGFAAALRKPVGAEELYRAVQAAVEPTPRGNIRVKAMLPVTVNDVPLDCIEGECASVISVHGMYVRTLKPHPPNARISVRIDVNGRNICVDGVVLYSHRNGEGPFGEPGMGIKFDRIEPQDQEHLRLFINGQVGGGEILRAS